MNARYQINIAWSDEDECYVARVPALPGCLGHGDTYKEAVENIEDAIEGFLASMEAHGDRIPEPDRVADEIRRFAPVLNTAALARRAGMSRFTLASKLRRGTKFTEEEARKIRNALSL